MKKVAEKMNKAAYFGLKQAAWGCETGKSEDILENIAWGTGKFFAILCPRFLNLLFRGTEAAQEHGAEGEGNLFLAGDDDLGALVAHRLGIAHVGGVRENGNSGVYIAGCRGNFLGRGTGGGDDNGLGVLRAG